MENLSRQGAQACANRRYSIFLCCLTVRPILLVEPRYEAMPKPSLSTPSHHAPMFVTRLFVLLRLRALDLRGATEGLHTVLALLALLAGGSLGLDSEANTDETVSWLKLLQGLNGVVDERKSAGLSTTEVGPQAEDADLLLGSLVQLGESLAEVGLCDAGVARVEDVNHHLLSAKQGVTDEPPRADRDGRVGHVGCGVDCFG